MPRMGQKRRKMPKVGILTAMLVASAVLSGTGAAVAHRGATISERATRVATMAGDGVNVPMAIPQTWMFGATTEYRTPHVRITIEPAAQPASPKVRQV